MSASASFSNFGRGSTRFLLGYGPDATGGHIGIELACVPSQVPTVSIQWVAPTTCIPKEAKDQTVSFIEDFLRSYLKGHPVGSLIVSIVEAGWFEDRRNDLDRAAALALYEAIEDAGLPPLSIFAAPDA